MIKELLYLLIIIVGIPAGLILAKLTKDEIKIWKKRLIIIIIASIIISIALLLTTFEYKIPIIITLGFIILTCLTIIWKSKKRH